MSDRSGQPRMGCPIAPPAMKRVTAGMFTYPACWRHALACNGFQEGWPQSSGALALAWRWIMKVQPRSRVVVCDGGRYVIYENIGDMDRLDLRVVDHGLIDNPPAREQGDDRPGRYPSPNGQRSAVGQTDRHDLAERRFIRDLAAKVAQWTAADRDNRFVLIADPRSTGLMRAALPGAAGERIISSMVGDYVQRPVEIIEDLIDKA